MLEKRKDEVRMLEKRKDIRWDSARKKKRWGEDAREKKRHYMRHCLRQEKLKSKENISEWKRVTEKQIRNAKIGIFSFHSIFDSTPKISGMLSIFWIIILVYFVFYHFLLISQILFGKSLW